MGIFGKKGVEHWIKKGKICNWNKKFEKAIECFDKALEIDPKNEIAWNNMGFAYDNLGDFKKGIECFDKRLEINPNNVNSWNNKAYALTQLKKYEEALECFDKALELELPSPRISRPSTSQASSMHACIDRVSISEPKKLILNEAGKPRAKR